MVKYEKEIEKIESRFNKVYGLHSISALQRISLSCYTIYINHDKDFKSTRTFSPTRILPNFVKQL